MNYETGSRADYSRKCELQTRVGLRKTLGTEFDCKMTNPAPSFVGKFDPFLARPVLNRIQTLSSERKTSAQLDNPHVRIKAGGASDYASGCIGQGATAVANVRVRAGVVNVIEGVIGIAPDF